MKLAVRLIILGGLATTMNVRADRNDKFIVGSRFDNSAAVTYVNRGSDLLEKGDLQGARQNFDAALRADPKCGRLISTALKSSRGKTNWTLLYRIATPRCDCDPASSVAPSSAQGSTDSWEDTATASRI